jgi:hypothetical protein
MTEHTNTNNDTGIENRARTDGGTLTTDPEHTSQATPTTWTDINAFQRDCLVAIAALDDSPKGTAIQDWLEVEYDEELNHGRVYPALNDLVEDDLLEKGSRDGRTNEYALTEAARRLLRGRCAQLAEVTHS